LFRPEELEDHCQEVVELKKTQARQERWSTGIEIAFFLLVIASAYPYVYISYFYVASFLHLPMFLLLNAVMLYSVVVMRFAIKRMPNLLVNENLVLFHVLLFTVVTALWMVDESYVFMVNKAYQAYNKDPTEENYLTWFWVAYARLPYQFAYATANSLLNLFMLYMLHSFSIFKGFV